MQTTAIEKTVLPSGRRFIVISEGVEWMASQTSLGKVVHKSKADLFISSSCPNQIKGDTNVKKEAQWKTMKEEPTTIIHFADPSLQ